MNEVNIQPVDLGDELRHGVEPRFHFPPVVFGLPVAHEFLDGRQGYALGVIVDGLLLGPAGRGQAPAEIDQRLFGHVDTERADRIIRGSRRRMDGKQAGGTCCSQSHCGAGQELAPVVVDDLSVGFCRGDGDRHLQMRAHWTFSSERAAFGKAAITSAVVRMEWA